MKLHVVEAYGAVIFELSGDLVGGVFAEKMETAIKEQMAHNRNHIIADLKKVKYVDSSGIGILIRSFTTIKNNGGLFVLANLSTKIEGLLSITKLNQVFEIFDSVEEAQQIMNKEHADLS